MSYIRCHTIYTHTHIRKYNDMQRRNKHMLYDTLVSCTLKAVNVCHMTQHILLVIHTYLQPQEQTNI